MKPINLTGEMDKAYQRHLQVMLLAATGLKTEVAERIQANDADLARRFAEVVHTVLVPSRREMWLTGCSFCDEPVSEEELQPYF